MILSNYWGVYIIICWIALLLLKIIPSETSSQISYCAPTASSILCIFCLLQRIKVQFYLVLFNLESDRQLFHFHVCFATFWYRISGQDLPQVNILDINVQDFNEVGGGALTNGMNNTQLLHQEFMKTTLLISS